MHNLEPMKITHTAPRLSGLATDLYQLTMAAGYHANGRHERASFEMFVRRLPENRSFLVAAGLEQALSYLSTLSFNADEIDYLRSLPVFAHVAPEFFDYLRGFRFTGEVWAMPEGTIVFPGEPLLRVTAPLIEAQIVETFLLSTINFQTMIAGKAARVVEAAQGRGVIEFGARRAHGMGAGIYAARAGFIGGCIGTSNVEAGYLFNIPVYGTAGHSWTLAFEKEMDAFRAYHQVFPESTTLLLDTYDTLQAARLATEFGLQLRGVRLDSGDIGALAKQVRAILDEAGMTETRILASNDLDEYKIADLLAAEAPVDLFGVGTELSTSRDAPALGGVYKLVEVEFADRIEPKMKLSREKATYPYRKQVWRNRDAEGNFAGDIIAMAAETELRGEPLLKPTMRNGQLLEPSPTLTEIQQHAKQQLEALPPRYKAIRDADVYPVRFSDHLFEQRMRLMKQLEQG
ncbi:MAG TPA: nicotinate phosphoribosyltransferase [Blastocatellia bacterium]|nr:nicotinate phosphoribosyltransferase [Blastocatellia bacterium]HMV86276.1 nicotinate phosphoribosyltransferase [Blastocatellia bacterium]HMY75613.1 nicotinate phosphoribosyltransferase [Blastocatellia bacterium]HMZ18524.1 nicotinate phosphoribosyltransferase [Blastocatellia bacterium]HNG34588.1 nicotinate phosphoribosyltransferase [Blastocatellia bacterium]